MLGQDQNPKHYDLIDRIGAIEDTLKRLGYRDPSAGTGFQVLPDGSLFAQGGLTIGGGSALRITEPVQMPVPTNVTATSGASFDTIYIDVSWNAPTGLGADQVAAYFVQATKGLGVPIETTVNSSYLTTRIQPVEPNTTYTIRVASVSRNGRNSSVGSTTITTGGDTTPPATPTFPSSPVLPGNLALSVRWNANTEPDTANGKGQYRIVVSIHSDLSSPVYDQKTGGTVAWVPNLNDSLSYYVGVYAIDSSGNQSVAAGIPSGGPFTPLPNVTDTSSLAFGGGNVIRNSGFEDYFPDQVAYDVHWTLNPNGATIAKDITTSHGAFGIGSAKITGTGDAYLSQDVALNRGTYILSAWVKADSIAAASGSPNAKGVALNSEMITGTYANHAAILGTLVGANVVGAGIGTYDWTRIAIKFDVTAAGTIRIYPQRGYTGACTGTAWFDEIQLEQGNTLTGYAPRPDEITSDTIKSTDIQTDAITSPKIIAGAITAGKVAAGTIGATEIQAHSIVAGNIAAGTITGTEIAGSTITGAKIVGGTITGGHIAGDTITAGNLAANSVTANELTAITLDVGKFIESHGYVPNSLGWHIGSDGSAEFNSVTVRGAVYASSGTFTGNLSAARVTDVLYMNAGVTVQGDISVNGQVNANSFHTDGSAYMSNTTVKTLSVIPFTGFSGYDLQIAHDSLADTFIMQLEGGGAAWVNAYGFRHLGGGYQVGSRRDLKKKIKKAKDINGLDIIRDLQFRQFTWKQTNDDDYGFIADELPDFLATKDDEGTHTGWKIDRAVVALAHAVSTLDKRLSALEN